MSYRIKSLVWEEMSETYWRAKTAMGELEYMLFDDGFYWRSPTRKGWNKAANQNAARAACEEDYRKRLLTMLEEVEDHSQSIFQDALRLRDQKSL